VSASARALERYARAAYRRFPLAQGNWLVRLGDAGTPPQVVDGASIDFLEECGVFRTLEEHAARLEAKPFSRTMPVSSIRPRLASLVDAGLLVSHSGLLERALGSHTIERRDAQRIETVGFVTRDRPQALIRAVESCIANMRAFGRMATIVVVDATERTGAIEETGAMLRRIRRAYGGEMRYVGMAQRRALADRLKREGCPPRAVALAMGGAGGGDRAYGANRNVLQLATAGRLVLSLDDDIVCRLVGHPDPIDGLAVAAVVAEDFFFLRERAATLALPTVDADVIGIHDRLLGRLAVDCLRSVAADAIDIESADVPPRASSRILLTRPGVVGDSATATPRWCHFLSGSSFERLVASREAYRTASSSREVLRVVRRATLASRGWWMGCCAGMDNRDLLPPFMPAGRGEDGIFMLMTLYSHPGAYAGCLPLAVSHFPIEPRGYPVEAMAHDLARIELADLVQSVLDYLLPTGLHGDARRRLVAIGDVFGQLGRLPEEEFIEHIRTASAFWFDRQLRALEQQLDGQRKALGLWRTDVQAQMRAIRTVLQRRDFPGVEGLAGRAAVQTAFRDFGLVIRHWPEIIEAAKRVAIGAPVGEVV
jgi:hypothetical protein